MKKTPKKRAPTDATLRNTRATKKREAAIEARGVQRNTVLEARVAVLELRVAALETPKV